MTWFWFGFAFVIANAAALGFYFALRLGRRGRMFAWLVCSGVIVLSPCWVPPDARALRFLDCVVAVTLLWKVYDAYREPALAAGMGVGRWVAYLPNWFWFVLRRVPRGRPARRDWLRVAVDAPLMVAAVALCVGLLRLRLVGRAVRAGAHGEGPRVRRGDDADRPDVCGAVPAIGRAGDGPDRQPVHGAYAGGVLAAVEPAVPRLLR